MNYTTDYTVILTAIYIFCIAIAYCPSQKTQTVSPVEKKIVYFPEIPEPVTEPIKPINPSPASVGPVVSTAIAITEPEPEKVTEPAKNGHSNDVIDLALLGIRDLKKLASKAKIKRYSSLSKQQLINCLT